MNTHRLLAWCFVLLSTSTASRSAFAASPTVAMAPATVVPASDRVQVVADLAAALAAVSSVQPVSSAETASMFTRAARAGIDCDPHQAPCAARVAAFAGVDFMVVADVGVDAATVVLVDGRDGRVLRRRQAPLATATRRAGLVALVGGVLMDVPVNGRLRVDGPAGLALQVDGAMVGTAPMEVEVEAGAHDVNGVQVVVPAAGLLVVARLPDAELAAGSPLGTVAVVTGVAGAVLGLAGGIGAAVVAPTPEQRSAMSASAWNSAVGTGRALVVVAAVGVGLVVVGAGMWVAVGGADDDTDIDTDVGPGPAAGYRP